MSTARLFAARGPLGLLNRANSARIASLPRPNFQGTRALASEANDEFTTIATLRMDPERPYTTSIMSRGKHGLVADEPAELGGTDLGPNPYELLLAALGSCTNITTAMYASRKKIPLESVETRLRIQKIHRKDCESCTSDIPSSAKIDRIEKIITFNGNLTDEQRKKLFEISERCPVKMTLQRENEIISRFE